jgi:hypothetical protein
MHASTLMMLTHAVLARWGCKQIMGQLRETPAGPKTLVGVPGKGGSGRNAPLAKPRASGRWGAQKRHDAALRDNEGQFLPGLHEEVSLRLAATRAAPPCSQDRLSHAVRRPTSCALPS